jgi:hypothetical protein
MGSMDFVVELIEIIICFILIAIKGLIKMDKLRQASVSDEVRRSHK